MTEVYAPDKSSAIPSPTSINRKVSSPLLSSTLSIFETMLGHKNHILLWTSNLRILFPLYAVSAVPTLSTSKKLFIRLSFGELHGHQPIVVSKMDKVELRHRVVIDLQKSNVPPFCAIPEGKQIWVGTLFI